MWEIQRDIFFQSRCIHCGGSQPTRKFFKKQRKDKSHKKSPSNPRNYNIKSTEHNGRKPNTCFRCRSEDHFITNVPKLETPDKKVYWNTEKPKTCAYRSTKINKKSENSTDQSNSQKIYVSMAYVYSNAEIPRRYFGDIQKLTNCLLDSGATCHVTPIDAPH